MTSDFGSSRCLRFTRWKGRVSFESCMTYRSSHIYTRNHSSVTAIKHETKCISVSSNLLCKVCRKYSGRKVNLAAHTCVSLVPTCLNSILPRVFVACYRGTETTLPLGLLHALLFYILHKSVLNKVL